jgi:hypothetical protein
MLGSVSARDTTPDAARVRAALYRSMTSDRRSELAAEMSVAMRGIALDNIKIRHPDYDAHQAQMALYRLLVGDDLFRRAWPDEPLLAP